MPTLLLLGPEVEEGGGQDGKRGNIENGRHLIRKRFLGECQLVGSGQSEAPVLDREADAGEPAVEERSLQAPGPLAHLVVLRPAGSC